METSIDLVADEQVQHASNKGLLTLTSHRIRYRERRAGSFRLTSMTLDSIASCGVVGRSAPLLVVVGVLSLLGGLLALKGSQQTAAVIIGLAFVVAYFVTRRTILSVASRGGEAIALPVRGMGPDELTQLVDAIERAKLEVSRNQRAP